MVDLEAMSLNELRDLQKRVAAAIATYEDRQKKAALAEVEELLRQRGYSLADITALPQRRAKAPRRAARAAAKTYVNPADPSETWGGRGRRPRWFREAVAAGRDPETLRA